MGSSGYGSPSGRHLDPERVFALVIRRRRGDLFEYLDSVPGAHTDLQFRLVSFAGMALLAPRSGSSLPWLDDDSWALYWAKLCVPQTVGNAFSYPSDPVLKHAVVLDQLPASSSRTPAVLLSPEQTSYNAVLKHAVVLDQLSASSSSTPAVLLSPQQTSYNAGSRMLDQTSVFNLGRQASDFAPWRADSTLELAFAKLSLGQLGSDQMTPWELMQNNHGSLAIRVSSLHQHGSAQLTSQRLMLNGEDIKGKRPASEVVEQKVRVNVASLIAEDGTTAEAGTIVTERVKDLAGAPLQCAAEASMSSGEDSSVVILISKPVENGELRCGTGDLFIARARNGTLLTRLLNVDELAWIIYRHGPVLGDLLTDEEYENCDQETNCVYKGVLEKVLEKQLKGEGPEGLDGHVVVCYRYRFMCNGDLQLRAMDNHCEEGPLRWIKFAAFSLFTQLHVDPVDPGLLHRRKRNVKKDIFDPFKFLADKLYYFR